MVRDSIVFYKSFFDALDEIEDAEAYREVVKAIRDYAMLGQEPHIESAIGRVLFKSIKPQLDANNARYENSFKGGRPRKKPMVSESEEIKKPMVSDISETEKPMVSESEETEKPNVYVYENDNENEYVNDNDNDNEKEKKPSKKIYGEYKHVRLTVAEYDRLINDFGYDMVSEFITKLDEYLQNNRSKHYSDHNLTIRNWIRRDGERKPVKKPAESMAEKWGLA